MLLTGKKYLLTTDEWFVAPDGLKYNSIYGRVEIKRFDDLFGFTPRGHANWLVSLEGGRINIAGCRVNYAMQLEEPPINTLTNSVLFWNGKETIPFWYNNIYIANEE